MLRFFCPAWVLALLSLALLSCNKAVVMGTTTELTSSASHLTVGQTVTFTATVTPTGSIGTITFTVDGAAQAAVTLSAGAATWSTSGLAPGSHEIQADYSGDAGHSKSSAVPLTQQVDLPKTTVTVSPSAAAPTFGDSVTFTATVNPDSSGGAITSTPTGSIVFKVDGAAKNTAALSGGSATWTATSLTAGTHTVQANYGGDSANQAGSGTTSVTVAKVDSTISVAATPSTSSVGAAVTFTATVTPSGAGGSVSCAVGNASAQQVATVSAGTATWSTSSLAAGTYTIACTYSGDSNVSGSTAAPVQQTVVLSSSTVSLTSSQPTSTYGTAVTFTATVGTGATGTMVFNIDGADQPAVPVQGSATATIATLTPGQHTIGATYSGDSTFAGGPATAVTQTVNKAPTTTVLQVGPNPSIYGQPVTITATITPTGASGTVTFSLDGAVQPPVTISGGTAVLTTSKLAVGTRSISAAYSGDSNFVLSTAAGIQTTVLPAPTTLVLASSLATSVYNQPVTFTATLTPAGGETGSIVFTVDGVAQPPSAINATGVATLVTSTLPVGTHKLTAAYPGDGSYLPSAATDTDAGPGGSITQTVNKAPTTVTVSSSFNPLPFGQSVTFTATVSPATATGTFTFTVDNVVQPVQPVSIGAASLEISGFAAGAHAIVATYSGDANYAGSTVSPAFSQTVTPPVDAGAGDGGVTCTPNPRMIPLPGGADPSGGGYLAISGSQLAVSTVSPPFVEVIDVDGTAEQFIDLRAPPGDAGVSATRAGGVAFAGTMLTWAQANGTAGLLATSPLATLAQDPLPGALVNPIDVLFDGTSIFFAEDVMDAGAVGKVLPDGGGFARLVTGLKMAHGLTDDGSYVYWESQGAGPADGGPGPTQILRAAKGAPSTPTVVFANPTGLPLGGRLDVDTNNVYFGDGVSAVMYVPKGGSSTATTLFSGQTGAGDVRIDGTEIYWYAGAVIHKGALPGSTGGPTSVVGTASAPDWVTDATCLYYMDKTGVFAVAK
jgi:hypothetical protein